MLRSPVLGIHIRSASSVTRSWNGPAAWVVGRRWFDKFGGSVVLFGDQKDYGGAVGECFFVGACAGVMAGAAMVGICDLLVCVDSGPLHLARIQGVRHLCLWGGSRPGIVLGRDVSGDDIMGDVGCGFDGCHTCSKKKAECMLSITGGRVWERVMEVMSGDGWSGVKAGD